MVFLPTGFKTARSTNITQTAVAQLRSGRDQVAPALMALNISFKYTSEPP